MTDEAISRRQMFGVVLGANALALAGSWKSAGAETLKRTPNQILGPFYPVDRPPAGITDLVMLPGRSARAQDRSSTSWVAFPRRGAWGCRTRGKLSANTWWRGRKPRPAALRSHRRTGSRPQPWRHSSDRRR